MDTVNLDQSIQVLQDHKNEWACLPIPQKLALLDLIRQRLAEKSQAWVEASVRGKQMQLHAPEEGEEWTGGPWTLAEGINGYIDTLRALEHRQDPHAQKNPRSAPMARWQPRCSPTPSSTK